MVNDTSSAAPGALSRWAARVGVALIVLSLGALATLWSWDRTRAWETPRFAAARFVALDAGAADTTARARWLMVVNPGCPRCRAAFPRVAARRDGVRPRPALEVLVVDADRRPSTRALAPFPAAAAWWDSSAVWRGRWGHRTYAEVMRFAADGSLLGVDPPPAGP